LHELIERFEYPTPRVALGQGLRGLASACIDVSDGLYVDARRMLAASDCAGQIEAARLPLSHALQAESAERGWPAHEAARLALLGGEDYELCFCAPPAGQAGLMALAQRLGESVMRIGSVRAGTGLSVTTSNPALTQALETGTFDHFGR
jgi:thiamine-monophosphate kinase